MGKMLRSLNDILTVTLIAMTFCVGLREILCGSLRHVNLESFFDGALTRTTILASFVDGALTTTDFEIFLGDVLKWTVLAMFVDGVASLVKIFGDIAILGFCFHESLKVNRDVTKSCGDA
jgi:hypothetical protein